MSARRLVVAVVAVGCIVPLASCAATSGGAGPLTISGLSSVTDMSALTSVSLTSTAPAVEPSSQATLVTNPRGNSSTVVPGAHVSVKATDGRLTSVKVLSPTGRPLNGNLSQDGTAWVSTDRARGYGASYVVTVTAVDRMGRPTTTTEQFTTLIPSKTVAVAGMTPDPGTTFGSGMPLTITFDRDIENKADVEKHLVVTTPKPIVGAWRWLSDSTAEYRPETYWPGDIPITVSAKLTGVQVAPGVWGEKDQSFTFRTSDQIVGRVNIGDHTLTVRRNGKVIRTIPITTGKPGFDTRVGTKVVMTKERNRIMDAATGGTDPTSPEYYRLNVEYAMRLTWSGEFLHAAPWSEGSQGSDNVSHGCTGMSTDNAAWLYGITNIGDVYEYVNGAGSVMSDDDNGITVWNVPWNEWLADSKAGAQKSVSAA